MDRITQLLEFMKRDPRDPFVQFALALEYYNRNSYGESLNYFEKLVQDSPEYVGAYYHFGKLCETLGRREQAIIIYEKGIKISGEQGDLHAQSELQEAYRSLRED